jgi:hypothetical protein
MAAQDDLDSAHDLCENAIKAANDKITALGPRPADAAAGQTWDNQLASLQNAVGDLANLSASISAFAVTNALENAWPNLTDLAQVTAAAQANIQKIADITKALTALASIITFATSIVALVAQPTAANVGAVATAYKNVVSSMK